jgi:hypothetical protein
MGHFARQGARAEGGTPWRPCSLSGSTQLIGSRTSVFYPWRRGEELFPALMGADNPCMPLSGKINGVSILKHR